MVDSKYVDINGTHKDAHATQLTWHKSLEIPHVGIIAAKPNAQAITRRKLKQFPQSKIDVQQTTKPINQINLESPKPFIRLKTTDNNQKRTLEHTKLQLFLKSPLLY